MYGKSNRIDLLDWLKGCAIIAVVLDHLKVVPEIYVVWSVNVFVLVSAFLFSQPGYVFSFRKLALKIFQILFLISCAILAIRGIKFLFHIPNPTTLSAVFLNPYAFLVRNRNLGDIWYMALHLQFLVLFYFFLKRQSVWKPGLVCSVAFLINTVSLFLTHFVLNRLHTILVTSWLVILAAGFYGMRPLLEIVDDFPRRRAGIALASFAVLAAFYTLLPLFPWLFTNNNRAIFVNLPFYAALVLFLASCSALLENQAVGRVLKAGVLLLGRHSLAIYLTHEPFEFLWRRAGSPRYLTLGLCVLSGILFGLIADWLFLKITSRRKKETRDTPPLPAVLTGPALLK